MLEEFKKFILKGNVIDMAVGIVIGAAFSTVVKSFVENVMMPPIGKVMGGVDFSKLKIELGKSADGKEDVTINYGMFINDVISLLIVGFCVFLMVKAYNTAREKFEKKEEAEEDTSPKLSKEEELLTEIRDLLKK